MKRPVFLGVFIILTSISFAAGDTFEVPSDFPTIQQAINAASDYDIIVVDDDDYSGVNNVNLDFGGRKITLRSKNGAEGCTINGGFAARAFIFQSGEDSETVIDGFKIIAGLADYGGAIECQDSSPTIKNCIFINNVAFNDGGAIDCENSSPLIKNCIFNTNAAYGYGGAIECYQSSPTVKNCLFVGCYAAVNGGAVDCYFGSKAVITNCTIVSNSNGTGVAGGINSSGSSQPVITSCILWDNTGDLFNCSATFSCIEDGDTGLGNISSDPLFRDGPLDSVMGGYYLSNTAAGQLQSSPCIDTGLGPAVPFAEPNSFTTRTDSLADVGIVDIGFHYPDTRPAAEYLLTTSVVGGSGGSIHPDLPAPGEYYRKFADVSLTATPAAGYKVKQWTGAYNVPAPKTNNNIVTILGDTDVTVEFELLETYQLTTAVDAATPYGTIMPSSGPYQEDSVVTVTAIPAEDYVVEMWNGMPPPNPYDPNHFTVVMDSDKIVTVKFISKYITHKLTVEILDENGDPDPSLGIIEPRRGGTYLHGTVVDVVATPISIDYEIEEWTGTDNPASTDSHQTVTMIEDKHVTVKIVERNKYYLNVSVSTADEENDGTTVPLGGPFQFYEGEVATITAISDPGYELKWWKISGITNWPVNGDDYNVLNLTMDSDKDVEAAFWEGCHINRDPDNLRFTKIQDAIDAAEERDTVIVGDGIWSGDRNRDLEVNDVNIDIRSRNGARNCIIDCGGAGIDPNFYHRGFDFNDINDPNMEFTIRGFTIRNGFAEYGGGIRFYDVNASITIRNCILENNGADESGGGIYCFESEPVILNTEFFNNTSLDSGGGISCDSNSHAELINCLFAYNYTADEGGAIYLVDSDPNIYLCTVAYNTSNEYGDEGYLSGIYADESDPNIRNCIVGRNDWSALVQGSLWGDENYNGDDLIDCEAVFSCIENGDGGQGNISGDPLFITGPFGDFYLTEVYQYHRNIYGGYDVIAPSACIDTGEEDFYINLQQPPPDGYELPNLTTSVFSTPDDVFTDMGYHYRLYTRGVFTREITVSVGVNGIVQYYEIDDLGNQIGPTNVVTPLTSPVVLELVPYTKMRLQAVPDPNYIVYYWYRNGSQYSYYNILDFYAMDDENFYVTFEPAHFKTIHVPGSFPYIGIQDAIESARDGDTIVVAPGTYPGNGYLVDKAITITSIDPEDPDFVANTIIDCNLGNLGGVEWGSVGFFLDDIGQGPALLNGFTIVNGRFVSGGGTDGQPPGGAGSSTGSNISLLGGGITINGDHTVKNCVLRNCRVASGDGGNGAAGGITGAGVPVPDGGTGGSSGDVGGGGIYIRGGSPLIQDCLIEDCYASSGDGGNGGQGAAATAPPPATPSHPGGRGGDGGIAGFARGGGIYCDAGAPTFENVIVRNCSAMGGTGGDGGNGGASAVGWGVTTGGRGGDGGVPMPVFGGGVCYEPGTTPTFINCTIVDSLAQGGRGGNGGNAGSNPQNPRRGGIGGLTDTAYLLAIVQTYYESPPQYYGPGSSEFSFGTYDYYAPYNFSAFGGGVFCGYVSNSIFVDCDISNNVTVGAISGIGGVDSDGDYWLPVRNMEMPSYGSGAYIGRNTTSVFLDSTIQDNRANYPGYPDTDPNYEHLGYGGGVCVRTGRFTAGVLYGIARFNNCQITGNTSPIGGGIYATGLTNFDITDSNFFDNLAYSGAGIFTIDNINTNIARCNFVNNRADNSVYPENPDPDIIEASIPGAGGGLFLFNTDVLVSDCRITGNNATGLGGGTYMGGQPGHFNVKPRLNNCLIADNITNYNGGGVCSSWGVESTISNCTLADNTAAVSGGGIYCSYDSTTGLKNSIVWNNSAVSGPEMALNDNSPDNPAPTTLNVSYSDVEDGQAGAFVGTNSILNWGSGNIQDDPMFVNGDLGTHYLSQVSAGQMATSPCVDTGSTLAKYLGLHVYTTNTENEPDRDLADMGYHYKTYVAIPGDFDRDGDVDLDDLSILLSYWLEQNCELINDCEGADFEPDGDVDWVDYARFTEIFFLENVLDMTAPEPNPMTWEMEPTILSYHSVIMTATTATDASGVQYYFDCVSSGCHDSGLLDSPTYTDTGLADNAAYTYRVRASDKSPIKNPTGWSSEETVIIPSSSVDIFPPEPNPSTWEIEPYEDPNFFINMTATTATDVSLPVMYYFDCTSGPGNDSGWQLSPAYQDDVGAGTDQNSFCYTVKTKDAYGFETLESQQRCVYMDHTAPRPDPITWEKEPNAVSQVAINMTATTATDPCGVEYYFACTLGGGHNSGWQANPSYTDTGLYEGTTYTYKVRTRDKSYNQNVGDWSSEIEAYTWEDVDNPEPWPAEWAEGGEPNAVPGQNEIAMTAQTATDISGVEYYFECTYGDCHDSGWQDSPTYTDTGLDVNEIHTYRVRTQDKASPPNPNSPNEADWGWSTEKSALIDFITPTPDPTVWLVEPYEDYNDTKGCYQHRMEAGKATDINGMDPNTGIFDPNRVEYYFVCLHDVDLCSGWQDSPVYDVDVASPGLLYAYRVKARDKSTNHNETGYSDWKLALPGGP